MELCETRRFRWELVGFYTQATLTACFTFSISAKGYFFWPIPDHNIFDQYQPGWFVGALMGAWLLYPLVLPLYRRLAQCGSVYLALLAVAVWGVAFGSLRLIEYLTEPDPRDRRIYYYTPYMYVAMFSVGNLMAELSVQHEPAAGTSLLSEQSCSCLPPSVHSSVRWLLTYGTLRGLLADAALLSLLIVTIGFTYFDENDAFSKKAWWMPDSFLSTMPQGLEPLYALFLYGSCASGGAGIFAWIFRRRAFVLLGKYGMYVYLMHEPLSLLFPSDAAFAYGPRPAENIGAFMLILWSAAAFYAEYLEPILHQLITKCRCTLCGRTLCEAPCLPLYASK